MTVVTMTKRGLVVMKRSASMVCGVVCVGE
jgi:hypothetical protein